MVRLSRSAVHAWSVSRLSEVRFLSRAHLRAPLGVTKGIAQLEAPNNSIQVSQSLRLLFVWVVMVTLVVVGLLFVVPLACVIGVVKYERASDDRRSVPKLFRIDPADAGTVESAARGIAVQGGLHSATLSTPSPWPAPWLQPSCYPGQQPASPLLPPPAPLEPPLAAPFFLVVFLVPSVPPAPASPAP